MANHTPNTAGLTPGGKSLSGDGAHSPRISLALPADLKDQLDAAARARGCGVSKLVREILTEWAVAQDDPQ